MNFGEALEMLKAGCQVARKGWNGKGIFLSLFSPTKDSLVTQEFVFIDTTGLETENPNAPKCIVPWQPSQTDMLAEDWEEVWPY